MKYVFPALLIFLLGAQTAASDPVNRVRFEPQLFAQSKELSQGEAAAKVRRETGGRVLDVKTANQDGMAVYLVKVLLPDGRIRVVTVRSR